MIRIRKSDGTRLKVRKNGALYIARLFNSIYKSIVSVFKQRVITSAGTFESEKNLESKLGFISENLFSNASYIISPNGYKTSKIYALKPENGSGDLVVVRNTTATRINEFGVREIAPPNVARIDYSTGQPAILVEPQRTNLVYPSDIATTQVRAVTAGQHTLSFYGTGTVTLSGAFSGSLVGTGTNNRVTLSFTPTAGNLTLTVSGTVTDWQLEVGSSATSLIKTVSGSVTRNADVIYKTGISSLIGQTEGTIFVDYNKVLANDVPRNIISLNDGSNANILEIWDGVSKSTLGRILAHCSANYIYIGTIIGQKTVSPSGRYKICLTYIITPELVNFKIFINGVRTSSYTNTTYTAFNNPLSRLNIGNRNGTYVGVGSYNLNFILKKRLTDLEAIQLTTL